MKALIIGAVIAAAAGAAAGDGLQPVLARPPAPMEAAAFGASAYDADPAGVWTRPGPVPDYVLGTGWLPRGPARMAAPATGEPDFAKSPSEAFIPSHAIPEFDVPPVSASYPSVAGDILAGIARPEPVAEEPPQPPSA